MMRGEDILRIEHKLDVLINYLHGITNVPPAPMPQPIKGGSGATTGNCPITGSPIRYILEPQSGDVRRVDALHSGVRTLGPVPSAPITHKTSESVQELVETTNNED